MMHKNSQSKLSKNHWANINEVSFVFGMRFLFWIYRLFGRWPFRLMLYPILLWYVVAQKKSRNASKKYLQMINHLQPQPNNFLAVIRHFAAFAETILDKMLLWGDLFPVEKVQYVGLDLMQMQHSTGQGAIIICSHLGNLELCRALSRNFPEVQLTVLVHTKHAQAFNHMLAQLNPNSQLNLMQVTEMTPATAMLLSEKIAQGGFVVIAGDRIPVATQPRVAMTQFLGQQAAFPVGPYVMASIFQCPIYLMFSIQINTTPTVYFELLCRSIKLPRKDRDTVLQSIVSEYAARLEHYCLLAPLQWFNFYDFWYLPPIAHNDVSQ